MATLRINQLNVDAPWVSASVNGTRRDVPSKFQLPPGRYTVKLSNADLGLSTSCGVVLARDEVVTINVDIERKRCDRAGPKE